MTGEDELPEPRITFVEAGTGAEASLSGQLGAGGATVEATAAVLVGTEYDRREREATDYYQVDFGAGGKASYVVAGVGAGW